MHIPGAPVWPTRQRNFFLLDSSFGILLPIIYPPTSFCFDFGVHGLVSQKKFQKRFFVKKWNFYMERLKKKLTSSLPRCDFRFPTQADFGGHTVRGGWGAPGYGRGHVMRLERQVATVNDLWLRRIYLAGRVPGSRCETGELKGV